MDWPSTITELVRWKGRVARNRPADGSAESEIRFLEYRLEVIASWPDSGRKQVFMEAIVLRLAALRTLLEAPSPVFAQLRPRVHTYIHMDDAGIVRNRALAGIFLLILLAGLATLWVARARHHSTPPPQIAKTLAPQKDLGLNVALEQNNARITWNPSSSAIAQAIAGTLLITDGRSRNETPLNSIELRHGSMVYGPVTNSLVTIELRIGTVTESCLLTAVVGTPPQVASALEKLRRRQDRAGNLQKQ